MDHPLGLQSSRSHVAASREGEAPRGTIADRYAGTALLAALMDSVEALVVVLAPDGTIARVNRAAERSAGRSARLLEGRRFTSRFAAAPDRERIESLLSRAGQGGAPAGCEARLRTRGGEERVIAWSFVALSNVSLGKVSSGSVSPGAATDATEGLLATGTDLTERLLVDRALRDLDLELRHAHRLEALGRLAGGVAHDFHNVLTAILGLSEVLAADIADRPDARALALEIRSAAEQAALLTRQLTSLARKGGDEVRPLEPRREIGQMRDLLARSLGEDIVLDLQLDSGDARIACDPGQFTQLVLNLALNARDAMPAGGRLTLATLVVQLPPSEAAERQLPERCLLITVRDTGSGMDEATRARVFEPWFTTKGVLGTGIGLATVHDVVRQAGGAIAVESAVGQGTRFLLWLPTIAAPAPTEPSPPATVEPRARGTVLLVEDDAAVRRLMRESLRRQGCEVIEAADGREALARAHAHTGVIDLLVTDVIMPGMSGPELAERLIGEERLQRVLFVSGYPDDAMQRHGISLARAAFLEKPFTTTAFAIRVRESLSGAPIRA